MEITRNISGSKILKLRATLRAVLRNARGFVKCEWKNGLSVRVPVKYQFIREFAYMWPRTRTNSTLFPVASRTKLQGVAENPVARRRIYPDSGQTYLLEYWHLFTFFYVKRTKESSPSGIAWEARQEGERLIRLLNYSLWIRGDCTLAVRRAKYT